jgi:hypothetical protein
MDAKAIPGKPRGKTRDPQDSQWIFYECLGNMPQNLLLQVLLATIGIDQATLSILGDGVDGQVAAVKILLQRDTGVKIHAETMIAMTLLFLGTGKGIFFAAFGVQENRKGRANLFETLVQHFPGRAADHDPVTLGWPQTQ